jgi:hypothetical protein
LNARHNASHFSLKAVIANDGSDFTCVHGDESPLERSVLDPGSFRLWWAV